MPKKFIFENEDNDIIFEGYLASVQCEQIKPDNQQCSKKCIIGVPYCWIHLQYQHHLKIKKSTIPNAGLGLFAYNKKSNNEPIFRKKDKIIQFIGENIDLDEKIDRYGTYTSPYAIQVTKNSFIDPALYRGVASLANHTTRKEANAEFTNPNKKKEIWIRAIKNIYHNDEILLNYGNAYNFNEDTNHKTINVKSANP